MNHLYYRGSNPYYDGNFAGETDDDRQFGLPLLAGLALTAPFWAGRGFSPFWPGRRFAPFGPYPFLTPYPNPSPYYFYYRRPFIY